MSDIFELPNTNDATLEEILDNTDNKHIFLSSDWHIMKYKYTKERNPVNTTEIVKWCKDNIKSNDVFIYLGDLAYRYANQHDSDEIKEIYKSLPGIKVLILGNHDIMQGEEFYKDCGFDYIFNEFLYKNILFSHRPVDTILRGYITGLNIHGHIHTLSNDYDFIHPDRNVNVYPANYNNKPVTLDYILYHVEVLTKDNAPNGRTDGLSESAESIRNFLQDNINLLEAVNTDSEDRETVYLKTIKTIEKMGIKPKVSKESLNKFINCELNDFNNYNLCISIGKTGAEQKEVCAAVNKEIKNYGGKLTPDNYGTVFLSLNESSLLQEETKRSQIPDNEFGIPQERKYPLDTESHVRSAVKMFNYVEPKYEEQLAKAVIKKMKKFGIKDMKISKENRLYKYINESSLTDAKQCKYCGSNNIIKIETMFYGQQAYKCVDCNEILGTVPEKEQPIIPENVDTLIFDMGDVLVFSPKDIYSKSNIIPKEYAEEIYDFIERKIFGVGYDRDPKLLTCDLDYAINKFIELAPDHLKKYTNEIFKVMSTNLFRFPYTFKLLDQFKTAEYNLYYLSNWDKWSYELHKDVLDPILNYFDGGIFSFDAGCEKPNDCIYNLLINKYDLNPSNCLFFDDRKENIDAAIKNGLNGIVFTQDISNKLIINKINEDYKIGELDYNKHNWWHLSDKPNDKSGIDEELFSKTIDYAVNNDCPNRYFEKSNSCIMYLYTCNGEDDLSLIPAGVINVYKATDTGRLNWKWVEKYNLTIDDNGLIIKDPIHEATLLIRSLTEQLYDFTEETKMGEKLEKYDLKGTRTEQCLKAAFAGESEARNKYTYYAAKAKKDGYNQIGNIFTETANNEREHAKIWFKLLHDGDIPDTEENLKDAIEGEHYEWSEMYKKFAEVAREEGFDDIAKTFEMVGEIEKAHGMRYAKLLENIEDGIVFSRDGDKIWKCGNCGHIHIGKEAPEECPVCSHPQKFFELLSENY